MSKYSRSKLQISNTNIVNEFSFEFEEDDVDEKINKHFYLNKEAIEKLEIIKQEKG